METRNGLITFGIFIVLFAFSLVFSVDALANSSTFYGVLALIGFLVCLTASLFNGFMYRRNGEALAVWFNTYALVVGVVFVWFATRCGSAFKWW